MKDLIKKILKESAGVSFTARVWVSILLDKLKTLPEKENRIIIDCQEYPEEYSIFPVDYIVIDTNDWVNGYLDKTSGYDKDGNYVIHIMVLNTFLGRDYMETILNHEMKHAYQDWQRQVKGYPSISKSKESLTIYTDDFIKSVKDRINIGPFFKNILKNYYLLTDLERDAFMENVYDRDVLNDYKYMVKKLMTYDALKMARTENPDQLQKDWSTLISSDIPFLKKYRDYNDFLIKSTDYFRKRGQEILKKINKLEYVHGINEGLIKEQQITCKMISPKPKNGGNYISNEEALKLIDKIQMQGRKEIHDPKKLAEFVKTLSNFRHDIKGVDTNNDTVDTYLHKLRTLLNCYGMETIDNSPEDFIF